MAAIRRALDVVPLEKEQGLHLHSRLRESAPARWGTTGEDDTGREKFPCAAPAQDPFAHVSWRCPSVQTLRGRGLSAYRSRKRCREQPRLAPTPRPRPFP